MIFGLPPEIVLLWVVSGAILGALISDYKGRPIADGVLAGALLGLIGVLIIAIQPNLKNPPPPPAGPPAG